MTSVRACKRQAQQQHAAFLASYNAELMSGQELRREKNYQLYVKRFGDDKKHSNTNFDDIDNDAEPMMEVPPLDCIVVGKKFPIHCVPSYFFNNPHFEVISTRRGNQIFLTRQERTIECPISKKGVRALAGTFSEKWFTLNPGTFKYNQHRKFVLPETFVFPIWIVTGDHNYAPVSKFRAYFVPKLFTTTMQGRYVAIKQMMNILPLEIVELLSKQLGGPSKLTGDVEFSPLCFKYDVSDATEYATLEPTDFVSGQFYSYQALLDLTEKGILDIAIPDNYNGDLMVLTRENYEHVFSNGEQCRLVRKFGTVEKMFQYRQRIIDSLKKSLELLEKL